MPAQQKAKKRSQKIQSIQDKRRNLQKGNVAAEEAMRKLQESSSKKRSVSFFCRTQSIRTRWRMQKWRQTFRDCRQEKKEEAAMLRKQVIAARRPCGNRLSPWERIESKLCSKGTEKWERRRGQMPGREVGRSSEDEQEQDKASQQLALSASGGCNEGTPA